MQKKTIEKAKRWFGALPLHHIDTSIFLESESTEDGKYCRKYLQKVGYNYRGIISSPVLSELFMTVLLIKDIQHKTDLFSIIDKVIETRKIEFRTPRIIDENIRKIKEIDTRIDPMDMEILACAIEHNADTLVTLDIKLLRNEKIQQIFRIRIIHPRNLI